MKNPSLRSLTWWTKILKISEIVGVDYRGQEIDGYENPGHEIEGQKLLGHELEAIKTTYEFNGEENLKHKLPALEFPGGEIPTPGTLLRAKSQEMPKTQHGFGI